MSTLITAFKHYFEVISADTPSLLEEVFRLRYHVLCVEQRLPGFEQCKYPNGLEKDDYDRHSVHILVRHRPSNSYIGTARLVLTDPLNMRKPFPIEDHSRFDSTLIDKCKISRCSIAEISRLAVLSVFPHRAGKSRRKFTNETLDHSPTRLRFPHPVLALVSGIVRMCAEHKIRYWYAVMDPALNRLLNIYGLDLQAIGPITQYHGLRRPYFADLNALLNRIYAEHHEAWHVLTDSGRVWPPPPEESSKLEYIHSHRAESVDTLQSFNS